jgi:hypothetical protein
MCKAKKKCMARIWWGRLPVTYCLGNFLVGLAVSNALYLLEEYNARHASG